ncbi:hypothetical protein MITS9509_03431 [Synechococcus sp. MIT S9509]|uniref:DUF4114 domain-containing protein n=1 Tax=unclassified Synechococcus TaxID=2626047 RepID=UPI0007BAF033|nr:MULTISPECIES: DUF4114 domain-containing protein [unclassified Synechococcus]KZR86061.1 hypothetical protein MITS9504_01467 [Synechococcus sp. MIT S9504]KZR87142.1 hypothetical protein MITS9509_03431 [Synechococcus sp. MIT S9509]
MTSITPNVWLPVGLDVTRDGYQGRLGVSYKTGQTLAAGATNGLAVLPDPQSGNTLIYAGSVNGGVYVREVDLSGNPLESDTTWRWVSMPGSGYVGSQSIGHLAISADGRYLAVGRGDTSNYGGINTPGVGLQVGEILPGGDIRWIPMDTDLLNRLDQKLVSGLQWSGHNLITSFKSDPTSRKGPFNASLSINSTFLEGDDLQQEIHNSFHLQNDQRTPSDFRLGAVELDGDELFMRSRSWGFKEEGTNFSPDQGAELQLSHNGIEWINLQGDEALVADLLENRDQKGFHQIQRLAIHPNPVNGNVVAFLGSSKSGQISRIDRLEIDPNTFQLLDYRYEEFNGKEIGTSQATKNFSLQSNPFNPVGTSVVSGGNHFANSSFAPSLNFAGGLLQVDFGTESNQQNWTPLYGPRLEDLQDDAANAQFVVDRGQPHADSRSVVFIDQDGKQFAIQTDDGGIWALQLSKSKEAQLDPDFWWRSLSTTGLNSFEVMMSDWDPVSNTVISSFQDNAASFGQYGDKTFTNYWSGDGEIAIARSNPQTALQDIFLSSQRYYASDAGFLTKFSLNDSGDIVKYNPTFFQLETTDKTQRPKPWSESGEPVYHEADNFILPFEANPYNSDSIVMTGSQNIYETVDIGNNTWTFKKLISDLDLSDEIEWLPTAIDNQGSPGEHHVDSLYIATHKIDQITKERVGSTQILGRTRSNDADEYELKEFYSVDAEIITDIAHKPAGNKESDDTVYWIEGGTSVRFQRKQPITNIQQFLCWKTGPSGIPSRISLSDLGIAGSQQDTYGLQSVVFIPGNQQRPDQLVLGGLQGQWITELDPTSGSPGTFQAMPWQLNKSEANNSSLNSPGAHVSMTKYIPEDDLLIAGTMGKGSWIYSFSDHLGKPADSKTKLTTSEVGLQLLDDAAYDKRGNLKNDSLVFQIDRNLINSIDNSVDLELTLHDVSQWRRYLKRLSDYEAEMRIFENDLSQEASARFNNLSPASWQLEQITNLLSGIYQSDIDDINPDSILIPLALPKDVSQQILTITANDYLNLQPDTSLRYSIELADGSAASINTISLNGGSGFWPEIDINQLLKDNSNLANKLSENSDYTLIDSDLKLISPLTMHGAYFLDNTTAGVLSRNSNIELSGMPSRGLQMDLRLQNTALPSIGIGFELDVLRDQPAPGDPQEILTILDEDQLDSWEWYDLNYDPLSREGARLYDLDHDGRADWVYLAMRDNQTTDADPASSSIRLEQAIAADMSKIFAGQGLGDIDLTPIFSAGDKKEAVQVTTRARRDGVLQNTDIPLQLSASLQSQANNVNSFGMVIFNDGEPTDLASLSDLEELQQRSQILFSNLLQGDQTLLKDDDFKQQLSMVDYQQVRFFEVEGADLSELNDLDDPRLNLLEPKLLDDSTARIQSSSGLIVDLELSHSTGDLDALIGQQQTIAPLLDFTGLSRDMIVDASIEVSREAAFSSQVSFYRVLDTNGAVHDPLSGQILQPGDDGYQAAALHEANTVTALKDLTTENGITSTSEAIVQEQSLLAPVLRLTNHQLAGVIDYFAFADANPNGTNHIRMLGSNLIGFEGLDNNNPDFNDLIVKLNFSLNNQA